MHMKQRTMKRTPRTAARRAARAMKVGAPATGASLEMARHTDGVEGPLDTELLTRMDAYWRASNYLSVGQIYLYDNPLLKKPLGKEHVKPRLLGHWGTTPGLNFLYVHLNRLIRKYDLNMIFITGPGHG